MRLRSWIVVGALLFGCTPAGSNESTSSGESPRPPSGIIPIEEPTPSTTPIDGANPITIENLRPGDTGMDVTKHASPGELEGYAGATSVNHGESIGIHVSSDVSHTFTWALYRVGYYGGKGAKIYATGGPLDVTPQPMPVVDPQTGFLECSWPVTFTISTQASWPSGVFVIKLKRDDGKQSQVTFVVRADERTSAALVQIPTATYQAYNTWGGEGLYFSKIPLSNNQAKKVSYDRPYAEGSGSGQLFRYDAYFIRWAEAQGYDVAYATSVDVSTRPGILDGRQLFFSIGHDEYWTRSERDAVKNAIAHGTSVAFLSANDAYWQVRLEAGASGSARTVVCYKSAASSEDPMRGTNLLTAQWRDPLIDEPENALMGVMYTDYQIVDMPFVVAGSSHWVYDGTGLHDGDTLPLIVGYETDGVWNNGRTPSDLTVLGASPVLSRLGRFFMHNATVYPGPLANYVFAAGTIEWSWGLSKPGIADERVQRMTANLFAHAGFLPDTPGESFGADHKPESDFTGSATSVTTIAGSAGATGNTNGAGTNARFRHPTAATLDTAGNLYIADTGNNSIRRLANDANHTVTTIYSGGLDHPTGIAAGFDGSIYVADTGNNRVLRLARSNGSWQASVVGTNGRFNYPMGLAASGSDVYVADTFNHRVCRIDSQGTITTIAGNGAVGMVNGAGSSAMLRFPVALTAAGGALWIDDSGNRLIRRIQIDLTYSTSTVAGQHVDDLPTGGFQDGLASEALFMPQGGLAYVGGALYVADSGNGRIRRIANGKVTTFAGTGTIGGDDGSGATASLGVPTDIVARGGGSFYVVDHASSTIRLVTP